MRRLTSGLIGAVIVTAVLATGCGSTKKNTAAGSTGGTTNATTGTTKATTAPNFHGSSNSKFCDLARKLTTKENTNPNADLKTTYQQLNSEIAQISAVTPSAIKSDMQTLTGALKKVSDALAAANYDVTKVDPNTMSAISTPDVQAASNRVEAYTQQVCGITTTTS